MRFQITLFLILILAVPPAWSDEENDAFDEKIIKELGSQAPAAVPIFQKANQLRTEGNFKAAAESYAEVQKLAPDFDHAVRRQCTAELQQGLRFKAILLCKKALKMNESAENMAALSMALASSGGMAQPTIDEENRALDLALEATKKKPDDKYIQQALCNAALRTNNNVLLAKAVEKMKKIAPEYLPAHIYAVLSALMDNRPEQAAASLERARELGLPDKAYQDLKKEIALSRDGYDEYASGSESTDIVDLAMAVAWQGGLIWISAMIVLIIFGWLLSRAALRAAKRVPTQAGGEARGIDALLRKIYRVVLWLCCGYYYLSIPFILFLVVGAGGGIIYGFFAIGRIPYKLLAFVAVLVLVTVWAVLKSIFVRSIDADPGVKLDLGANPGLRGVLNEVAGRVGTRPVDNVYMTPGTDVAVMERGSMFRHLTGRKERCLILGAGVLDDMKISEFKSILAHEYGHFSNQDTAGGGFAIAVRRSLLTFAENLARGGAAAWYNPAWLFVNFFYRVFLRISQGASRLQEVLADRWAAFAYGSETFERGFTHVLRQSVRFDHHAGNTIQEVVEGRKSLPNLYTYTPAVRARESDIEQVVQEIINSPPSPYDSHPAPGDRLKWVRALSAKGTGLKPGDSQDAWSLFSNPAQIQREMTDLVRGNLAMDGIAIASA